MATRNAAPPTLGRLSAYVALAAILTACTVSPPTDDTFLTRAERTELPRDQLLRRRRRLPPARRSRLAIRPLHHLRLHDRGARHPAGHRGRRRKPEPRNRHSFRQDGRLPPGQHPRRRGLRERGAPDAPPRPPDRPPQRVARVDGPPDRAHLQRRRQRTRDPHQPRPPARSHRRHGPAPERPGLRPQPRSHEARLARGPFRGAPAERIQSAGSG